MELELPLFACETVAFAVTANDPFSDVVEELLSEEFLLHDVNRINKLNVHGIIIDFLIFSLPLQYYVWIQFDYFCEYMASII